MMYKLTNYQKYYDGIMWNLNWYNNTLNKIPYGLLYLDSWGVLRYASAEAGLTYIMYKEFGIDKYNNEANKQSIYFSPFINYSNSIFRHKLCLLICILLIFNNSGFY